MKMEEFTKSVASITPCTPSRRAVIPEFDSGTPIPPYVPIAPTLKSLKVGETAEFPAEQRTSALATVYRLRKQYARQGWDVEMLEDESCSNEYLIKFKRIS